MTRASGPPTLAPCPAQGNRRQPARGVSRLRPPAVARARRRPRARELRARGQRTMRQLLDAGAEVFATKGYHAARVDDIVKLAETSHGTFYLYFANKEDLFRALAAEVADEMQTLAEALGPLEPGPGRRGVAAGVDRAVRRPLRALRAGDPGVDRGRDRQPASSAGSATTC